LIHLERGKCCGNQCRHCPYGWTNVPNPSIRRLSNITSGDPTSIQQRLREIAQRQNEFAATHITNNNNDVDKKKKKRVGGTHGGRLTEKNVPYTKTGDSGTSQLLTGERRTKNDVAFEAMGSVDELCSAVGVAHSLLVERLQEQEQTKGINSSNGHANVVDYGDLPEWLLQVMSRLFDAGSHIAKPARRPVDDDDDEGDAATTRFTPDGVGGGMDIQHVEVLEDWIDIMTEQLPELRNFILPTGSVTAAHFHVCRTVCRRAERSVVPMVQEGVCDPNVMKYLNRLSDFLFTAARWCNYCQGNPEIEYRRPERRDKQRVATARDLKTS
jgi:cob(I)alamin adenosyltransferase